MPRRTWTDEQLRAAVAQSTNWSDVLRKLGLTPKGDKRYRIMERAQDLGLSVSHFSRSVEGSSDFALVRQIVATSTSVAMVAERLGLENDFESLSRLRRRLYNLNLSMRHFETLRAPTTRRHKRRWTDEDLRAAVAGASTIRGVLLALGLVGAGGNYDQVQRTIRELGLDTSHLFRTFQN